MSGESVFDIFNTDAFSVISLTDAVNKVPFIPGLAGKVIDWTESSETTTSVMIEEYAGVLALINPTPRGGPGTTLAKEKRVARTLRVPHYQIDDAIYADEVQGVRAFGSATQVQTVQGRVNSRLGDHVRLRMDPTLEYQRIGALQGIILNGDGSQLYNLFTEFGVSAPADVQFTFSTSTSDGSIRGIAADVSDSIADEMGGVPFEGVGAFCGAAFWKQLIAAKEVRETFLNQQQAAQLRGPAGYRAAPLDYGDITWQKYRGKNGSTPFVNTDQCRFFAYGSPGLWRTVYAPADYEDTVNTPGLPRYARQWPMENGKGRNLEAQMNALNFCTRPKTLVKGTHS